MAWISEQATLKRLTWVLLGSLALGILSAPTVAAPTAMSPSFKVAYDTYIGGDPAAARSLLEPLATAGDPHAQVLMAKLFDAGAGGERDEAMAAKWLARAAAQGIAEAAFDLAGRYFQGQGINKHLALAAKWWRHAADAGFAPAQYNLGLLYDHGIGVERDPSVALAWYKKAALLQYPHAEYALGVFAASGHAMPRDYTIARQWFEKAAEHGVDAARFNLSLLLATGAGGERDAARAHQLARLAMNGNLPRDDRHDDRRVQAHDRAHDRDRLEAPSGGAPIHEASVVAVAPRSNTAQENRPVGTPDPTIVTSREKPADPRPKVASVAALIPVAAPVVTETRNTPQTTVPDEDPSPKEAPTSPPVSPIGPAPRSGSMLTQDWILAQNQDDFTLQLATSSDGRDLTRLIKRNGLMREAAYFLLEGATSRLYVGVYGVFASFEAAQEELLLLPPAVRESKPYVRRFATIHKLITP